MLPTGWAAWTDTGNNEAFLAGILALTQNAGTMYAKAVLDEVPFADQIDYLPNPLRLSDNKPVDQLGGVLLHVIEGSKNKDASYDLIRHLLLRSSAAADLVDFTGLCRTCLQERLDRSNHHRKRKLGSCRSRDLGQC